MSWPVLIPPELVLNAITGIIQLHQIPVQAATLQITTRQQIQITLQPISLQPVLIVIHKLPGHLQLLIMMVNISRSIQENTTGGGIIVRIVIQMLQIMLFSHASLHATPNRQQITIIKGLVDIAIIALPVIIAIPMVLQVVK